MLTCQQEGRTTVIERGWSPAVGGVTALALRSQLPSMWVIIARVARSTIGRCTFEGLIRVAGIAINRRVFTRQEKCGSVVIEGGRSPASSCMARLALTAKRACVRIVPGMAGSAIHGRALEDSTLMAIFTGNTCMFSIQAECELRMIHRCEIPAFGGVAGGAGCSKLAVVFIILGVAGVTILRRGF